MSHELLLGYAVAIITLAALSGYPDNFKPTITENPRVYLLIGIGLGTVAVILDISGVWF